MNTEPKKHLLATTILTSMLLTACGGGSSSSNNNADNDVVDNSDDNSVAQACPAVGNIQPEALGDNRCGLGGVLTEDAELSPAYTWWLDNGLQVGGQAANTTLTVQAGTRIFGGGTDYVLVYPGSSLQANGTRSAPIHFTSDDEGVDGTGEWGGIYLRGSDAAQGESLLNYVVVAEGGAQVQLEVNDQAVTYSDNIVLNGVDSNTRLTFVQSHNSARDGVHIMNGDPRLSWILATGAERDGIWYRDFNGLIKDLMVIHNRDADGTSGRSGIYASRTTTGQSNPRIVNATLVGRDNSSESAAGDDTAREFGILFADNSAQIRMGNVLIANFRNGCIELEPTADMNAVDATIPGPNYLDGIHCANEAGPNGNFIINRTGAVSLPAGTVAANNSNGDGVVYYNGAGGALPVADTAFSATAGGIQFTGETADRSGNFTSSWYLNNIRGISNGLVASNTALNAFLEGDTNRDGSVDQDDTRSPFIITDDGAGNFNQDVTPGNTGGYDLTHIGAVRGGAVTNAQFDDWTVATGTGEGFVVMQSQP